jgi:hypothetical protein
VKFVEVNDFQILKGQFYSLFYQLLNYSNLFVHYNKNEMLKTVNCTYTECFEIALQIQNNKLKKQNSELCFSAVEKSSKIKEHSNLSLDILVIHRLPFKIAICSQLNSFRNTFSSMLKFQMSLLGESSLIIRIIDGY